MNTDEEKHTMRKLVAESLLSEQEDDVEMEGGFARFQEMASGDGDKPTAIPQIILAVAVVLPIIIWLEYQDVPEDTCGIPVEWWLLRYW